MFGDLKFFIAEAFISIRRSWLMMFIAVATITVSLIIFGLFLLMSVNIGHIAKFVSSRLEIRVYLKDGLTRKEISDFKTHLISINGVNEVEFIDKNTAWKEFSAGFKDYELPKMIENPLPNSFMVRVNDFKLLDTVAKHAESRDTLVDEVWYAGKLAERISVISRFLRYAGFILVSLLSLATLLIIVNTIRLTVLARHSEIEIMQLVGATHSFIRWPFIIEGLIMGLLGASFSVIVLRFSYLIFSLRFQENIPFFPLVFDKVTLGIIYSAVIGVGAFLGVIGAYISVSRSLKTSN
ncbi:permease-like cell division protein FtsX [Thermoproteota archaeon]